MNELRAADADDMRPSEPSLHRRDFLARVTALGVVAATLPILDCASDGTEPVQAGITITNSEIRIDLAQIPALVTVPGFLRIPQATALVLRTGASEYRAFSAICTHAGCSVSRFSGTRMICPCHLSEYDLEGRPVAGPAPLPLTRFTSTLDSVQQVLVIQR